MGLKPLQFTSSRSVRVAWTCRAPRLCYSAADNAEHARRALQSHSFDTAPRHVFGDILQCLPKATLQDLRAEEARAMEQWKSAKHDRKLGNLIDEELQAWQAEFSEAYLKELHKGLSNVGFEERAWCYVHSAYCPLSPRHGPDLKEMLWIEGGGSTCCPWSAQGGHDKFLDKATLVFFTWLYHWRFIQPDMILHENTAGFPSYIFNDIRNATPHGQVKCVASRLPREGWEAKDDGAPQWTVDSETFSPEHLGIPSSRARRYVLLPPFCPVREGVLRPRPGGFRGSLFQEEGLRC